jgi:hypothetical protein
MDDIIMVLKETGFERVDWVNQALDRDQWQAVANRAINLRVLQNV